MTFLCPICFDKVRKEYSPCKFCGFTICNKCINTMYFYNKYGRNVCPQCKTTDCYTHKSDLDDVHLYIKKLEIEKCRQALRERDITVNNEVTNNNLGCCIIC